MSVAAWILVGGATAIIGAVRATFSPCGQSMLASLSAYAETSRGSRWSITAGAFGVGAVLAGASGGLVWGGLGSLLPGGSWRVSAAIAVIAVALVIDATPLRRRLPLTKRQVNEDWMATFRNWVYGFGFGSQLGLGFISLVACAAIYATFAIELLSGHVVSGVAIGTVFGATKALSLLPAVTARDPVSLLALHRRLLGLERGSARAVVAGELIAVIAAAAVLV